MAVRFQRHSPSPAVLFVLLLFPLVIQPSSQLHGVVKKNILGDEIQSVLGH